MKKNLQPQTIELLERVEALSGCPVEFKPDSSLHLKATLRMARNGAPAHVLHYRPSNDPLDYWVAYQVGFALRLFELAPNERFDFVATGDGGEQVRSMLTAGQALTEADQANLPRFAELTLQWALMNLRSFAIGMRIDQWIAEQLPTLQAQQRSGIDSLQQENLGLLSQRTGNLCIPVPLLAPVAACALFADRLLDTSLYTIAYRAAGVLDAGRELLNISDALGKSPADDRNLVDAWAASIGMTGWYAWQPYKP